MSIELGWLPVLPSDAPAELLLDRVRTLEAVGAGLSPMHPDTWEALGAAWEQARDRFDEERPVLVVPWQFGDDTVDALRAVFGPTLELRIEGDCDG